LKYDKEKTMDNIHKTNRERWNALASANVEYSQPFLDYTPEKAIEYIHRYDIIKDVTGMKVLCLASGGGQDSVAFGLLGAEVTILDLSDVQLKRDRQGAAHHDLKVETIQGDMRDLSVFPDNTFDVVWHPYSINFVPSVEPVYREVARVLKPGRIYYMQFANPFVQALDDEAWDGAAYPFHRPYIDGEDITQYFPHWDVDQPDGIRIKLDSPHEFRHNLSTVLNTMARHGFIFLHVQEWMRKNENPEPGSWPHFTQVAPPWFDSFWMLSAK
jgi:ubiquinone/menaquinone biosynthesis C-methylase UbiE